MIFSRAPRVLFLLPLFCAGLLFSEELTYPCQDSVKAIKKLSPGDYTLHLTGPVNTPLLAKIRRAISANEAIRVYLDLAGSSGMESLDKEALAGCKNLTGLRLSPTMQRLSAAALTGCTSLADCSAPEESSFFSSRDGSLFSKDGLELILCPPAFSGSYLLPDQVTAVSSQAFALAEDCQTIIAGEENAAFTSVDGLLYTKDMETLVRCPRGRKEPVQLQPPLRSIGYGAFSGCTSLTAVSLPESLEGISMLAFENASSLQALFLPSGLLSIGKQAFLGASALKAIVIPRATSFIGSRAFYRCKLLSIQFEDSEGWTNGKKLLKDLPDVRENPERFNHPGKYWPYDIYRKQDD